ncbi:MAG: bifunctional pyr operon transcriptional regulator/uracil phosphoribosyltransferase PyrR [Candidatus Marinimicrobia bacterium]|nr:bifunctional pyr operon transcriptional regulator/uracil phosphoribosyltransferase PyrR [Candidatus Neomarinimicrobiota bacterium]MBT3676175.1 bifunctional pyr operon transcriptional regulator/uracil phosphoribosyltransferase PyrR [Candidatus Neomarinimicrobiota bacterium]MBT3763049.1 bifunctional pyr operon transcriptional regulator/uracil phosphoribosyltransferase PyrR [Candidatus Neomarinimicrobiota bacterium]MBT4270631.1 bifunctional pyr operon transcriptional regulator/uracil phosphoribo
MASPRKKQVMDAIAVNRSVTRLAHEILERNGGPDHLMLIGILTRGEPLAKRLQSLIHKISEVEVPIGSVDITFHRDDFRDRLVVPQVKGTDINDSIDDKIVVLVDDVLFTGRTIRAAMDELNAFGRPKCVQLAVLVDRGHREVPIRADFVGKNIPTHEGEHVEVRLKEVDEKDLVTLTRYSEEV